MRTLITLWICLLIAASAAWATDTELKPSQVFAIDSPSIVLVKSFDENGKPIALGSGVVIANGIVVSNCHVVENSLTVSVYYGHEKLAAMPLYSDVERDLCSFTVKGLNAPPVRMGSTSQVQVGDAAYAIGAPEGLELTLSGGLISSLRHMPGGVVLQMTTPISPGSSGGGLFDSQARLIGITSYYIAKGEELNFALPVEWVKELPQRSKLVSVNVENSKRVANATHESDLRRGIRALIAGDCTTALAIFRPLARTGNTDAQYQFGFMYENSLCESQDYARAVTWYRKAAEQGDVRALFELGFIYSTGGWGVAKDYAQAARWYRMAAEQGDKDAQFQLGLMYSEGHGVPQDYTQAATWYRKAAEQGDKNAQSTLAWMYTEGRGVKRDYKQALEWYRKAAEQGDVSAQTEIKSMCWKSTNPLLPKGYAQAAADYAQISEWCRKDAEQGDVGEQESLGFRYYNGDIVPKNYVQAAVWFRKAAEQGDKYAEGMLGRMYQLGQGVPQSYVQAATWYRKAANHGVITADVELGLMYSEGRGVPQDYVAAYALFNLSASINSTNINKTASEDRTAVMGLMTQQQIGAGQSLTREMQRLGVLKALDAYMNSSAH